jgi:hypothetical protein
MGMARFHWAWADLKGSALWGAALLLALAAAIVSANAATRTAPPKKHDWQVLGEGNDAVADARACPDCPAALQLKCLGAPGSGLLELSLPVAGVSNGREGATKQIRLIVADSVLQRRAHTFRRDGLYVPHVLLGGDDDLFDRLEAADLLELSFYGQRAYVGLGAQARAAIHAVRARCWPDLDGTARQAGRRAVCTWHVPLGCFESEAQAQSAGRADTVRTSLTHDSAGWCANAVIDDLAAARIFADLKQTHPRRACVWLPADARP